MKTLFLVAILLPSVSFASYQEAREAFSKARVPHPNDLVKMQDIACEISPFAKEDWKGNITFGEFRNDPVMVTSSKNVPLVKTAKAIRTGSLALRVNSKGEVIYEQVGAPTTATRNYPQAISESGMVAWTYGVCRKSNEKIRLEKVGKWWNEYLSLPSMTTAHIDLVSSYASKSFNCSSLRVGYSGPVDMDEVRYVNEHRLEPARCSTENFKFCQKATPSFLGGDAGHLLGWRYRPEPDMLHQYMQFVSWYDVKYISDSSFMVAASENLASTDVNDRTGRYPNWNVSMLIKCSIAR